MECHKSPDYAKETQFQAPVTSRCSKYTSLKVPDKIPDISILQECATNKDKDNK